jgi:broad-specificity NMP kinase
MKKREYKSIPGHKAKILKIPCLCGHRSTGYSEKDFDERKVHEGAKIEFEHTCNKELAEKIAIDHMSEFDQYYKYLEEMENKMKKIKQIKERPDKRKKCKRILKKVRK